MSNMTDAQLKRLHRAAAKVIHPDLNADLTDLRHGLMVKLNAAYQAGDAEAIKVVWAEANVLIREARSGRTAPVMPYAGPAGAARTPPPVQTARDDRFSGPSGDTGPSDHTGPFPDARARRLAEKKDWREASTTHSVFAYTQYLKAWPDGEFARIAKGRISRLQKAADPDFGDGADDMPAAPSRRAARAG